MGFGALAGGIVQGWNQESDRQLRAQEAERRQKEWEDAQEIKSKVAAAQGIGVMEQASGADAMSGAQNALQMALARAETPEAKAQVEKDYAETLNALEARKETPAQFLMNGKTFAARPTDDAVTAERRAATVAALGADPERAMAYESNAINLDERKRTATYEAGKNKAFQATPWGQALSRGETPTPGEQLHSAMQMFAYDAQNGKASPEHLMSAAEKMRSVTSENYAKTMQALHSGASKETIIAAFNAAGQKIDPSQISDPRQVEIDSGNGLKQKTYEVTVTDASGRTRTINGLKELDALGEAGKAYQRAIEITKLGYEGRKTAATEASAGASADLHGAQTKEIQQKTTDRKDLAEIHGELNTAIEKKDSEGEKKARAKLSTYVSSGRGASALSAEERRANFYLASGKAKTPEEAATMSHEKVQASVADDFREFSKPQGGITPRKEDVEAFMALQHGPDWKKKLPGGGGAAPVKAGWGVKELK